MKKIATEKFPAYGGQALIEGVVMRGQRAVAAAMRAPDGNIVIHKEELKGIYKSRVRKIPFLRGIIILWDALGLGTRFLTISANLQSGEDEKLEGSALYLSLGGALLVGVGLFFVAPALLGQFTERLLAWSTWWGNLLEGLFRLGLVIGYIWAIGQLPDIKRVFQYHGAEHKTINAFEAGAELTPENVKNYPLEHPRCGTSFLLTLIVLSVIVFAVLGPLPVFWRLISRVITLPLLAGMAYEYIRWTASHLDWPFVSLLIRPNLALQRLTTSEPSLDMLEVSITAFKTMVAEELADRKAEVIP